MSSGDRNVPTGPPENTGEEARAPGLQDDPQHGTRERVVPGSSEHMMVTSGESTGQHVATSQQSGDLQLRTREEQMALQETTLQRNLERQQQLRNDHIASQDAALRQLIERERTRAQQSQDPGAWRLFNMRFAHNLTGPLAIGGTQGFLAPPLFTASSSSTTPLLNSPLARNVSSSASLPSVGTPPSANPPSINTPLPPVLSLLNSTSARNVPSGGTLPPALSLPTAGAPSSSDPPPRIPPSPVPSLPNRPTGPPPRNEPTLKAYSEYGWIETVSSRDARERRIIHELETLQASLRPDAARDTEPVLHLTARLGHFLFDTTTKTPVEDSFRETIYHPDSCKCSKCKPRGRILPDGDAVGDFQVGGSILPPPTACKRCGYQHDSRSCPRIPGAKRPLGQQSANTPATQVAPSTSETFEAMSERLRNYYSSTSTPGHRSPASRTRRRPVFNAAMPGTGTAPPLTFGTNPDVNFMQSGAPARGPSNVQYYAPRPSGTFESQSSNNGMAVAPQRSALSGEYNYPQGTPRTQYDWSGRTNAQHLADPRASVGASGLMSSRNDRQQPLYNMENFLAGSSQPMPFGPFVPLGPPQLHIPAPMYERGNQPGSQREVHQPPRVPAPGPLSSRNTSQDYLWIPPPPHTAHDSFDVQWEMGTLGGRPSVPYRQTEHGRFPRPLQIPPSYFAPMTNQFGSSQWEPREYSGRPSALHRPTGYDPSSGVLQVQRNQGRRRPAQPMVDPTIRTEYPRPQPRPEHINSFASAVRSAQEVGGIHRLQPRTNQMAPQDPDHHNRLILESLADRTQRAQAWVNDQALQVQSRPSSQSQAPQSVPLISEMQPENRASAAEGRR